MHEWQSEIQRYYRAKYSGAWLDCTTSLLSGEKRGGQEVSGQWRPRRALGGGWFNEQTRSQTARHGPAVREGVYPESKRIIAPRSKKAARTAGRRY